jgi:hypothetical protein
LEGPEKKRRMICLVCPQKPLYNELVVTPGKEESGYLEGEYWGRIVDSLIGE